MVGADASRWRTWNEATDSSINGALRLEGIPLPDGLIYPEKFGLPDGLSAEEYFRSLVDQQKQDEPRSEPEQDEQDDGDSQPEQPSDESSDEPEPPACENGQDQAESAPHASHDDSGEQGRDEGPDGSDSPGDAPDASGASASDVTSGENSKVGDGDAGSGDGQPQDPVDANGNYTGEPLDPGQGGSCSDGQPRPWELGPPDEDNPGLDEADQEQLVRVSAKNALKDCGKGAGGHRRWAETILDPPVDPAARLLNLVRRYCDLTVGIGDRTYRRPSRRNGNPSMAMPSNVAPLPRITVIVDTSGSMSEKDLGLALGMIRKVLNSFRIRDGIRVITGDAKGQTKQLCLSDPRRIELTGGGGTNMAAIIAEALQARPQPQMILVVTDGWTPWPSENPGVPIVACITRTRASLPDLYRVPDFITTLELKGNLT